MMKRQTEKLNFELEIGYAKNEMTKTIMVVQEIRLNRGLRNEQRHWNPSRFFVVAEEDD